MIYQKYLNTRVLNARCFCTCLNLKIFLCVYNTKPIKDLKNEFCKLVFHYWDIRSHCVFKGTHCYVLFVVTAAGVVLCGSPKKQPRTSSIVQFIFFLDLWDQRKYSEKSGNFICLDPCILNRFMVFWPYLDLYQSFYWLPCWNSKLQYPFSGFHC